MSVSVFFDFKCLEKIEENIDLAIQKLANPSGFFTFEVTGSLVDAAKGGLGGLSSFAEDFIEQNSEKLLLGALKVTGLENDARSALDLVFNSISAAVALKNDLILMFVKKQAESLIIEIDEKAKIVDELEEKLRALYNAMITLADNDSPFTQFLTRLRDAILKIEDAQTQLFLVRGTLQTRDFFLARSFETAETLLREARDLMQPLENNEFLQPTFTSLLTNAGAVTDEQRLELIVAIPRLSKQVINAAQGYFERVLKINGLLVAYMSAIDTLSSSLPAVLKKYVISLLDTTLTDIQVLKENMADVVNNDKDRILPDNTFNPNPLTVSVNSYKWMMQINTIIAFIETIPKETLETINLTDGPIGAYRRSVEQLQDLDTVTSAGAVLTAEDAQEQLVEFEQQLLTFLIAANATVGTAAGVGVNRISPEILALGRTFFERIDLTRARDTEIKGILQAYIDYPVPDETNLRRLMDSLFQLMSDAGLDRAFTLFSEGDYNAFFGLNGKNATYVGAGLAAVALLKDCFDNENDRAELSKIQFELERDQDLLNFKFSFDFDLAILNNIDDCLRFTGLSTSFNLKEIFCELATQSPVGTALNSLLSKLSF